MKKRGNLGFIIYIVIMLLAVSWGFGLFAGGDDIPYSKVVELLRGEQVKKQITSDEDLLALRNKLKERKGMKS